MGQELLSTKGLYGPQWGWQTTDNPLIAGEYHAIGLDLQGMSPETLNELKTELEQTKTKLEANDVNGLSKHHLTGNILQTGVLGYFGLTYTQSQMTAKAQNIVMYRNPSYGSFSTSMGVQYFWGVPKKVTFDGVMMDIDRVFTIARDLDNDAANSKNYMESSGNLLSASEHLVPEKLFSTPQQEAHGVSAVKALALAASQGQKIYTISQNNLSSVLPKLSLDSSIKTEIQNAVYAGSIATVHEANLNFYGWQGAGYTLIDNTTGAGAFKISGGAD
ncbi:MAG: hypothetical protein ACK4E7_09820 [Permianibacter sp.]